MRVFKTLSGRNQVDLISYIKEYGINHPNFEILVGCDSQNRRKETIYAIVIGLYNPGKGAHVLYSRFTVPREKDNVTRLINEVWFSVEVAEQIRIELNVRAKFIDIDLNPDPRYKSNAALTSAVGIVTGMGYAVRHKGHSPMMTYAADNLVKG
jgi:predicted RNase H-related nuclease YkuK (DUF458 family)